MKTTKHADKKCRQRGINMDLIDFIIQFGSKKNLPGGATGHILTKKDKDRWVVELKKIIQKLDHMTGVQLVESSAGTILTAYHK